MITLTKAEIPVEEVIANQHLWPIRISVVSTTTGVPNEVFVYHRNTMTDESGDSDIFECVASASQLQEFGLSPVMDDGNGNAIPFYRSAVCEFHCRNAAEAHNLWLSIQADMADLSANVAASLAIVTAEEVVIP